VKKDELQKGRAISEEEKQDLLEIAKKSIASGLKRQSVPVFRQMAGILEEKRGAFVSLHRHGRLRGCIGCIEGRQPLGTTISNMACAAAFNDPRFPPLAAEEFGDVEIEISVLTPLEEIRDIDQIEVGIHGLYLVNGFCSGLLLPQVAEEYEWDRNTFLEETCRKAGLPAGAWKDKHTKIYIFSAEVFGSR
jgi:AmmeMemoRadiSam system protein A